VGFHLPQRVPLLLRHDLTGPMVDHIGPESKSRPPSNLTKFASEVSGVEASGEFCVGNQIGAQQLKLIPAAFRLAVFGPTPRGPNACMLA
jgi:hypothetical protein